MISLTALMTLKTVISSLALGTFGAIVNRLFLAFVKVTYDAFCKAGKAEKKPRYNLISHIYDFCFFLIIGVAQLVFLYCFADGVMLLYPFVCTVTSFIFTDKILIDCFVEKRAKEG